MEHTSSVSQQSKLALGSASDRFEINISHLKQEKSEV